MKHFGGGSSYVLVSYGPERRAVENGELNDYESGSLEALRTVCERMETKL
jgi:hypothetical protein